MGLLNAVKQMQEELRKRKAQEDVALRFAREVAESGRLIRERIAELTRPPEFLTAMIESQRLTREWAKQWTTPLDMLQPADWPAPELPDLPEIEPIEDRIEDCVRRVLAERDPPPLTDEDRLYGSDGVKRRPGF